MAEYIVDTNVVIIAQNQMHMSLDCSDACFSFIEELLSGQDILVVDDNDYILSEYKQNLNNTSQYNLGNRFLKWIYTNMGNPEKIKMLTITYSHEKSFEEIPQSIHDCGFDRADKKFIAVAIANQHRASIVQAADSKWIGWAQTLQDEGIGIHFVCFNELTKIYKDKKKK